MSEKHSPAKLRAMALEVLAARKQGSPRYEVFLMMLMMRIGTLDRRAVEQRIEELAK
jgi:hypothetical protein